MGFKPPLTRASFHNPRPVLAALARAQQTSSQGFVRRYSDKTVAAIDELLSDTPDVTVILRGFTALAASDLAGIDGPVGLAATAITATGAQ